MTVCKRCLLDLPEDGFEVKPSGIAKKLCGKCCKELSKISSKYKREHPSAFYSGTSYKSRSIGLKELGFSRYSDYLASDLWRRVRSLVYKLKGHKCYLCDAEATELHHNRYHKNDLIGKRLKYINPICRQCHQRIEFRDGEKATVGEARKSFQKSRNRLKKRKRNASPEAS